MIKIRFKKWSLIQKALPSLFSVVSTLWLFGIFFQFVNSLIEKDYSMFNVYGQIALTLFGFTLIGGIFEKSRKQQEIMKKLFDSSLSFLTTAISFYFMYSLSSVFTIESSDMNIIQTVLIVGSFSIAILIGFYGIINGLLNLYKILVDYRVSLE